MSAAARPVALSIGAAGGAACVLAACRGILGIDALPPLDLDAATEAAPTDAPGPALDASDTGRLSDAVAYDAGESGCATDLRTDPDNCGACGHRCCGASCVNGICTSDAPRKLEVGSTLPSAIAVEADGGAVYWTHATEDAGFAVVRLAAGSATPDTVATGLGYVNALQVGPDAVFATTADTPGRVVAIAPKAGPATVTTIATGRLPEGLMLSAGEVWWTDWGTGPGGGAIHVAAPDGTGEQTPYTMLNSPQGIVLSGGALVWTEYEYGHDVVVGSPDGAAPTPFDLGSADPAPIVAVDGGVVWGDFAQGTLNRLDLGVDGGQPYTIGGATGQGSISAAATDGVNVYWLLIASSGPTNGALWFTPLDGSSAVQLAGNLACPVAVATDGRCVYWVNTGVCPDAFQSYVAEAGTGSVESIDLP